MGNRETSFLGAITLRLMRDLPPAQAGWLVHALAVWIMDGELPDDADVPPECLGAWIAIREESVAIAEARKQSVADKRKAALARWNADECRTMQDDADECRAMQSDASRARRVGVGVGKGVINSAGVDTRAHEDDPADSGQRTAVDPTPSSSDGDIGDERIKSTSFDAWARLQPDPVAVALEVTGEGKEKKGVYGKRLRKLGKDRFLDVVCGFRAQVAAGETVRNPGAALTAQLNEAVTAMEVCAR